LVDDVTPTESSATTETAPANDAAVDTSTVLGAAVTEDTGTDTAEAKASTADEAPEADAPAKVVPETYELTAPEGTTLNPADIEAATPIFKKLGLSNEEASELLPVAADFAKRVVDQANQAALSSIMEQRTTWLNEAKSDKEIGGAQFDANVVVAAKGLDALGFTKGSPLRNLLDDSGLGNHPEMIRAWVKVGRAIAEDSSFERSGNEPASPKTFAETLYPKPSN